MASQPPATLPVLYKDLLPLQSTVHGGYRNRPNEKAPFFANVHAVPLTIDEFVHAQRYYPIVFSAGDNPVPLALLGLNEGVNVFVDEEGAPFNPFYVPAYVRRYPYLLARLQPDAEELSLCFDPTSDLIGEGGEGEALFDGDKPTEQLNAILKFCEDFEMSAQRTNAFMAELKNLDLLIDGEVSIQAGDNDQPFVYRGFQMIAEDKLHDMNGDQLRKINQNGILPLLMAHLFSLPQIRDIFGRQMMLGKVPAQMPQPEPASA
ncbi:MAG: SapC family protein [Sphingomonas sp.]|nr:SapC family protein [Sphingomonas sp.]